MISIRILQRKTQSSYGATLKRDIEKGILHLTETLNLFPLLREDSGALLSAEETVSCKTLNLERGSW